MKWNLLLAWIWIFKLVSASSVVEEEYKAKDPRSCFEVKDEETDWYNRICKNWRFNWWETLYSVTKALNDKILAEHINGNYDWAELEAFLKRKPYQSLDMPDYVGPIKITQVEGKGEGWIAIADIQLGQLLLASKAIARVFPPVDEDGDIILDEDDDPLHKLYSAKVGSMSSESKQYKDLKAHYSKNKDSIQFEVVGKNVLSYGERGTFGGLNPPMMGEFFYPSFLNHNCIKSNAYYRMYGDFMVVRATKNITAGQEILIGYTNPSQFYEKREETPKSWGFQCDCELCKTDRAEPPEVHLRRREIHGTLYQGVNSIQEYFKLMTELENMREFRLNYPVVAPMYSFIEVLLQNEKYDLAYKYFWKLYTLIDQLSRFEEHEEPIPVIQNILFVVCRKLDIKDKGLHITFWINELRKWIEIQYGSTEAWKVVQYNKFRKIYKNCDTEV